MCHPGKLSERLQQAEVELIDKWSCNLAAYHGDVTDRMLCAGLPQGGVDTCQVWAWAGHRAGQVPSMGPSPIREGGAVLEMAAGSTVTLQSYPGGLSFTGGQWRAPPVLGGALAGRGHRQLGPGLWNPQHTRCLHQCPCLPGLDLCRAQGQCQPAQGDRQLPEAELPP